MITDEMLEKKFEFNLSVFQHVYYAMERWACHILLRRPPPVLPAPSLLNLGCGPRIFAGWVNADEYAPKRFFREAAFRPNWRLDITRPWACAENHWDGIFTEHVVEHVSYSQSVFVLKECLRTLKPGAWLRVSVPDLRKFLAIYYATPGAANYEFPHPTLAVSFLTQMHLHKSTWDADLLRAVMTELGFADVREASYGTSADPRIVLDDPEKAHDSLYVEGRKPPSTTDAAMP